jgi:hypothetical protein
MSTFPFASASFNTDLVKLGFSFGISRLIQGQGNKYLIAPEGFAIFHWGLDYKTDIPAIFSSFQVIPINDSSMCPMIKFEINDYVLPLTYKFLKEYCKAKMIVTNFNPLSPMSTRNDLHPHLYESLHTESSLIIAGVDTEVSARLTTYSNYKINTDIKHVNKRVIVIIFPHMDKSRIIKLVINKSIEISLTQVEKFSVMINNNPLWIIDQKMLIKSGLFLQRMQHTPNYLIGYIAIHLSDNKYMELRRNGTDIIKCFHTHMHMCSILGNLIAYMLLQRNLDEIYHLDNTVLRDQSGKCVTLSCHWYMYNDTIDIPTNIVDILSTLADYFCHDNQRVSSPLKHVTRLHCNIRKQNRMSKVPTVNKSVFKYTTNNDINSKNDVIFTKSNTMTSPQIVTNLIDSNCVTDTNPGGYVLINKVSKSIKSNIPIINHGNGGVSSNAVKDTIFSED